ncbi:MAG: nucleoside triphosphate pyrophosphatase [Gammaproteobacteria bacterium]|nr:MAG: nucleoside triphosphate pyrophosphatase [Gammaproteobacteria bacterium]
MTQLVLASSSPYRRELLARLMVPFEVMSPEIDETPKANETPQQLVERLSIAKAQAIIPQYPNALIIGSDQVAVHGNEIVGKPRDHDHAVQQLQQASGKHITLYTGLALVNAGTGNIRSEVIPFTVVFRKLTDEQIETYLLKEQPYKCAGSVKSEGLGIALLERFEGEDPNTLIGLPLIRLVKMLEAEGLAVI